MDYYTAADWTQQFRVGEGVMFEGFRPSSQEPPDTQEPTAVSKSPEEVEAEEERLEEYLL